MYQYGHVKRSAGKTRLTHVRGVACHRKYCSCTGFKTPCGRVWNVPEPHAFAMLQQSFFVGYFNDAESTSIQSGMNLYAWYSPPSSAFFESWNVLQADVMWIKYAILKGQWSQSGHEDKEKARLLTYSTYVLLRVHLPLYLGLHFSWRCHAWLRSLELSTCMCLEESAPLHVDNSCALNILPLL